MRTTNFIQECTKEIQDKFAKNLDNEICKMIVNREITALSCHIEETSIDGFLLNDKKEKVLSWIKPVIKKDAFSNKIVVTYSIGDTQYVF